ncbi:alpha/beta fold hydrolase [bacterium]|nr:alpha/beta fold hydrolase [bacterium]
MAAHHFEVVRSGDCALRVAVQGDGPLVLMVHGWPESWYSWRHQMEPIARAGYTAAAIDVRGYGGSDRPHPVEAYAMAHMVGDLQAVADQLGGGRAILIGHDWGAPIVWNSALVDPRRFTAVAGLSIPHMGRGKEPFISLAKKLFTDQGRFFYMAYFQDEGPAEAECEADVRGALRRIYYSISGDAPDGSWPMNKKHGDPLLLGLVDPDPFPGWMTPADLDYFVGEFERSGFRGPFNRYRNFERDFAWSEPFKDRQIEQPALFISGTRDMGTRMGGPDWDSRMKLQYRDLRGVHMLDGCGHWTQQERPQEVNRLLLDWLSGL